ncbi:cytochrome-c peroxidase [Lishizhenia sp.]|uniref:cytochrome-c peroxidase n=1 Tax=Lishizhenia sp. TaxID=2497594 RepID=UPI00299E2E7E|nr:cytochrome c peroxidase [Lishizhenia sp.]MDX1447053.1 cytochrome c peroxidase [Lishizhenia sp.]
MIQKYFFLSVFAFTISCKTQTSEITPWEISYPEDNAPNNEIAAFGKELFFDKNLSVDNSISCASCHLPEFAFADTLAFSKGVNGRQAGRNTPSIINSAFSHRFMGEGQVPTLEMQVLLPLLDKNEMGASMKDVIQELKPKYNAQAQKLFNRDLDPYVLTRALANYERTLVAYASPFDQYFYGGDNNAISDDAKAGWKLFSEDLNCVVCHPAPKFTAHELKNNGLYKDYPDEGRYKVTGRFEDKGKFKVPSLRNVELTAPYMHDGKYATLEDVVAHYAKGGEGHPNQDSLISGFEITQEKKVQLLSFLKTLTDTNIQK